MAKSFAAGMWEGIKSPFDKKLVLGVGLAVAPLIIETAWDSLSSSMSKGSSSPRSTGGTMGSGGDAPTGGLSSLLDAGQSVVGTVFDSLKPLSSMSDGAAKRHGYMGSDGSWTERGYNRATSADWDRFQDAHDAFQQSDLD